MCPGTTLNQLSRTFLVQIATPLLLPQNPICYHKTTPLQIGTQFEQLVQRLMEEDGDISSPVWRNPLMVYSKDPITTPLTTLTSEALQTEAVKLFKVNFYSVLRLAPYEK